PLGSGAVRAERRLCRRLRVRAAPVASGAVRGGGIPARELHRRGGSVLVARRAPATAHELGLCAVPELERLGRREAGPVRGAVPRATRDVRDRIDLPGAGAGALMGRGQAAVAVIRVSSAPPARGGGAERLAKG